MLKPRTKNPMSEVKKTYPRAIKHSGKLFMPLKCDKEAQFCLKGSPYFVDEHREACSALASRAPDVHMRVIFSKLSS